MLYRERARTKLGSVYTIFGMRTHLTPLLSWSQVKTLLDARTEAADKLRKGLTGMHKRFLDQQRRQVTLASFVPLCLLSCLQSPDAREA